MNKMYKFLEKTMGKVLRPIICLGMGHRYALLHFCSDGTNCTHKGKKLQCQFCKKICPYWTIGEFGYLNANELLNNKSK